MIFTFKVTFLYWPFASHNYSWLPSGLLPLISLIAICFIICITFVIKTLLNFFLYPIIIIQKKRRKKRDILLEYFDKVCLHYQQFI